MVCRLSAGASGIGTGGPTLVLMVRPADGLTWPGFGEPAQRAMPSSPERSERSQCRTRWLTVRPDAKAVGRESAPPGKGQFRSRFPQSAQLRLFAAEQAVELRLEAGSEKRIAARGEMQLVGGDLRAQQSIASKQHVANFGVKDVVAVGAVAD